MPATAKNDIMVTSSFPLTQDVLQMISDQFSTFLVISEPFDHEPAVVNTITVLADRIKIGSWYKSWSSQSCDKLFGTRNPFTIWSLKCIFAINTGSISICFISHSDFMFLIASKKQLSRITFISCKYRNQKHVAAAQLAIWNYYAASECDLWRRIFKFDHITLQALRKTCKIPLHYPLDPDCIERE